MRRPLLLLLGLLLLWPPSAGALDVPPLSGHVNDRAGLLRPETALKLEHFLSEFERSDSTQIVVLTIPSLEGESVEQYALKVAEGWGIGQKGKDNGAVLLIARDERKIRIEVGYGLEGRLTDMLSGRIIANEISPRFKAGNFNDGIVAGVVAMAEAVRGEYQGTGRTTGKKKERSPWGLLLLLLFLGPGMMLLSGGRRSGVSHHRRGGFYVGGPFGGGGFGGGFGGGGFGGGGGGFGGGGSSGGW